MQPVSWLPDWLSYPLFWVYLNQTLFTGIVALVIGYLTIKAIRDQISQSSNIEEVRNQRRHLANIAGLPIAFVEIMNYSNECWDICIKILSRWDDYESWDKKSPIEFGVDKPTVPFASLRAVQTAIETAPKPDADKIADLIGFAQVQSTRLTSLMKQFDHNTHDRVWVTSKTDVKRACRDSLELYFRASRGLTYSRRHSAHIEEMPDVSATEEFTFFAPVTIEQELVEYLKETWEPHWHEVRRPTSRVIEETHD